MNAVIPQDLLSAVAKISGTNDVDAFQSTMINTIFPNKGANANVNEVTAFLMVAKEYNLNPITKEIYAFPNRGGIQPIVSVDGWLKIINSHAQFDGLETAENFDSNGNLVSTTAKIHRKDRGQPVVITEYLAECKMNTEPWKKYPVRMLRHKATIQAARYAFGFGGIVDEDEAQRITPNVNDIQAEPISTISSDKVAEINALLDETGSDTGKFLAWVGVENVEIMNEAQYEKAKSTLARKQAKTVETPVEQPVEAEFTEVEQGEEIPL